MSLLSLYDEEGSYSGLLRKEVRDFAHAMEAKLQQNDDKGGWEECEVSYLFNLLLKEIVELHEAIVMNQLSLTIPKAIKNECIDVANFAMMIYSLVETEKGSNNVDVSRMS